MGIIKGKVERVPPGEKKTLGALNMLSIGGSCYAVDILVGSNLWKIRNEQIRLRKV